MAKNWIAGAIKHPGALHKELGVPQGTKISAKKLAKAAHSDNPTLAKRARLAETLKGFHHSDGSHGVTVSEPTKPHSFPSASAGAHGFGHGIDRRQSGLRLSGNPSAHRIGKR